MQRNQIPVLRLGRVYRSLDEAVVADHRGGGEIALVGQAGAAMIRRDARRHREAANALRALPTQRMVAICQEAARRFLCDTLPCAVDEEGNVVDGGQPPQRYVEMTSAATGLPHVLCRNNMTKIHRALSETEAVLRGLTRSIDPAVLDEGVGEQDGVAVSFRPMTDALGVVLPSNSPGVNSLWLPAIAMRTPVAIKPGRNDPFTPLRIIHALIAAGCPAEAFSFYPTDHAGADAILDACGRSILFGDAATTARYVGDSRVQVHGPGYSKVLIGEDEIDRFPDHLDVLVSSVADNGGRSCINASTIVVPRDGDAVARALAERLARIAPLPMDDDRAALAAFTDPDVARAIDAAIEEGLRVPGAEDVTIAHRATPRCTTVDGSTFLQPTVVRCTERDHPLSRREFLLPFAAVVECAEDAMVDWIGESLVVTAITCDPRLIRGLLAASHVDRLNIGAISTSTVRWDQPHEGNLFDHLHRRRAIQRSTDRGGAPGA